MALSTAQEVLARQLFDCGAIQFGAFRLKLHEKQPDAPLSPIYLNLRVPDNPKPGPLDSETVDKIGAHLYGTASRAGVKYDAVAGIPNAGEPLAQAFSRHSVSRKPIPLLQLVKEEGPAGRKITCVKEHPGVVLGNHVLLIDDLITEADTKKEAIQALRDKGFEVDTLLVLVDREQGGAEQLRAIGCETYAAFTLSDLLDFYLQEGKINQAKYDEVKAYLAKAT
jgi:uridine monophosphate synthetase